MKKKNLGWTRWILSTIIVLCSFVSYGQRIQQDIFDDLVYKADHYNAKLKKNIFDDLTFTDSNNNSLTFNKAYLEKKMGPNYNEVDVKSMFFQDLVMDYMQISGYEATYAIDILGKLMITDNQGKKLTAQEDIFGALQIKSETKKNNWDIKTTLSGDFEYKGANQSATLTKNTAGNRVYIDSNKTKIELPIGVWKSLVKKHKTEYHAFAFIIEQFLMPLM